MVDILEYDRSGRGLSLMRPEDDPNVFIRWDNERKKYVYVGKIPKGLAKLAEGGKKRVKNWVNWNKSSGI